MAKDNKKVIGVFEPKIVLDHFQNKLPMSNRPTIKSQLDAVIYFFSKMDAEMISSLLNDQLTYQDFGKYLFIRKLGDLFFEFSQLGDTSLLIEKGECTGCSFGINGFSFIGNKSGSYVDMVFVTDEEEKIIDIYECAEFYNKRSKYNKKNRLFLEKDEIFDVNDEDDDQWEGEDPFFGDDDILN